MHFLRVKLRKKDVEKIGTELMLKNGMKKVIGNY